MRRFYSEMRSNIDIKDVGAKTSDIYWAVSQRPPAVSCKSEAERLSDTKASLDLQSIVNCDWHMTHSDTKAL